MPLGGLLSMGTAAAAGAGAGAAGVGAGAAGGGGLLAGLGNAAGALGPLAGLFGGGGKKKKTKISGASNPATFLLNDLLGTKLTPGGFDQSKSPLKPGVFGSGDIPDNAPNAPLVRALRELAFNPAPISAGETGLVSNLTGGAQNAIDRALAGLDRNVERGNTLYDSIGGLGQISPELLETGLPAGIEQGLLDTGYRTNARPLYDVAIDDFRRNVLPQIAERVGATGGSLQSQGFLDTAGREGANLLNEATKQNVQLEEAAQQRRAIAQLQKAGLLDAANARAAEARIRQVELGLQGAGLKGSLLGQLNQGEATRLALPTAYANDIIGLNQTLRNEKTQQQLRPLSVFQGITGAAPNAPFVVQGYNPQGSGTANVLGSLASSLPDFLKSFNQPRAA